MMRTRSRADNRPDPKRSASATRSSAPNADSSSASAPSVSTSVCRLPPSLGLDLAAMFVGHGKLPFVVPHSVVVPAKAGTHTPGIFNWNEMRQQS